MKKSRFFRLSLFLFAVFLLTINIYGFFKPFRNPEIYNHQKTSKVKIKYTEKEVLEITDPRKIQNLKVEEKVTLINDTVAQGVSHYWYDEGTESYFLRVPWYKNYLLYTASYVMPGFFRKYEFCNYKRALQRGVGLCSEHAIILSGILQKNGIKNSIVGLKGHVVARAEVNDNFYMLDPDNGVTIPYDISEINKKPSIIEKYYIDKGWDPEFVNDLVGIYSSNYTIYKPGILHYPECAKGKYILAIIIFPLIWIIPFTILLWLLITRKKYELNYFFRLDDICPTINWNNFNKIKAIFLKYNVQPIIGIIPDNKDKKLHKDKENVNFWQEMRELENKGWVVAQHGYQHLYTTSNKGLVGINKYSEFAGLSYKEQLEKIKKGKTILEAKLKNKVKWWMAPAHSFDKNTCKVLEKMGFLFITDGISLYPFKKYGLIWLPQQVWQSKRKKIGYWTVCIHLNTIDEKYLNNLESFLKNNQEKCQWPQIKHQHQYTNYFFNLYWHLGFYFFSLMKKIKKIFL